MPVILDTSKGSGKIYGSVEETYVLTLPAGKVYYYFSDWATRFDSVGAYETVSGKLLYGTTTILLNGWKRGSFEHSGGDITLTVTKLAGHVIQRYAFGWGHAVLDTDPTHWREVHPDWRDVATGVGTGNSRVTGSDSELYNQQTGSGTGKLNRDPAVEAAVLARAVAAMKQPTNQASAGDSSGIGSHTQVVAEVYQNILPEYYAQKVTANAAMGASTLRLPLKSQLPDSIEESPSLWDYKIIGESETRNTRLKLEYSTPSGWMDVAAVVLVNSTANFRELGTYSSATVFEDGTWGSFRQADAFSLSDARGYMKYNSEGSFLGGITGTAAPQIVTFSIAPTYIAKETSASASVDNQRQFIGVKVDLASWEAGANDLRAISVKASFITDYKPRPYLAYGFPVWPGPLSIEKGGAWNHIPAQFSDTGNGALKLWDGTEWMKEYHWSDDLMTATHSARVLYLRTADGWEPVTALHPLWGEV